MKPDDIRDDADNTPKVGPMIGIRFDDDYSTISTDVARVWLTIGNKPDDTMSVAVIVRSVGHKNPIQTGIHSHLCDVVRKAVEEAMRAPVLMLAVDPHLASERLMAASKEPTDGN